VATRHKHALAANCNVVAADCTGGGLHFKTLFLAVLFLYFYNRQLFHCLFARLFLFAPGLGFLFAHSSDHFKNRICLEGLVKVSHEFIGAKLLILCTHSQKLMTRKNIHKRPQQIIYKTFHLLSTILVSIIILFTFGSCIGLSPNKHKLGRGHLHSIYLYIMQARGPSHRVSISKGMTLWNSNIDNLKCVPIIQSNSSASRSHTI